MYYFTMILTLIIIQAMTYIEGIDVKMMKKFFQRHLIIIKTSYPHLEENSTKLIIILTFRPI